MMLINNEGTVDDDHYSNMSLMIIIMMILIIMIMILRIMIKRWMINLHLKRWCNDYNGDDDE